VRQEPRAQHWEGREAFLSVVSHGAASESVRQSVAQRSFGTTPWADWACSRFGTGRVSAKFQPNLESPSMNGLAFPAIGRVARPMNSVSPLTEFGSFAGAQAVSPTQWFHFDLVLCSLRASQTQ